VYKGEKWIDIKWDLSKHHRLSKDDELIEKMHSGTLYYPSGPYFPGVEFVFVKER